MPAPRNSTANYPAAMLPGKALMAGATSTAPKPSSDVGGPEACARASIAARMTVTRQQQMIAVVDGEIGRGVEIGPAAPARLLGRFVDMNLVAGNGQSHGCRQARNSRTDDVDVSLHVSLHQMNA